MKDSSQNTEILHDFTEGDTAKYLKQKLGVEVKKLVSDPIPLIEGVSFHHEKIIQKTEENIFPPNVRAYEL